MTNMVRKSRIWLLVIVLLTAQLGIVLPKADVAEAADNGLAAKPYMGWSSYSLQVYTGNGQWITAENIKAQSDAMHEKLQPYGYEYINIDAAWNGGMDGYGRPIPSTTLYPNGLQEVIDYVHANGQKIGLYGIPGLSPEAYEQDLPIYGAPGCSMRDIAAQPFQGSDYWGFGYKIDFNQPCAQKYINSIADLYGEWGIDFLKFDSVTPGSGISDLSLDARDDVKAWSEALAPHKIWLELSWALDIKYIDHWKKYANGWRVDWDIECYCGDGGGLTAWPSIARLFPKAEQFWRHAGPGGWNDFDSLNIGNGEMDGITKDERRTAMSFWAISSAQLYTGNDLTNLDDYGLELLTNEEVIAVNQAGRPGHPVSTETEQQVWYANNGDGSYTVGLFNLGSSAATVNVNWSDIGLTGPATVRDLWSHEDLGIFNTGYSSVDLPSHASRLFKVVAQNGTVTANDDDTGFKYNGEWTRNGGQELVGDKQNLVIDVSDTKAQNSSIAPATATFNKKTSEQSSVATSLTLNGNTLSSISNNGVKLTEGTDYTVTNDVVTIKKEYLASRPVGLTSLTFVFSGGASQSLVVTVSDTTVRNSAVTPGTVSFDHKTSAQADIVLTTSLNGNSLSSVEHEGNELALGADYTVSGSQLILKQAFLASLQTGTTKLTFTFNAGAQQQVSLVVRDTSLGGSISINDDDASIVYTGGWNRSYNRGLGDYKDDVHYAEANNNDYFEYTFTGTGIEFITELDPSQGDIDIYVDNEFKQTVSTYNLGRLAQKPVYNITGLTNGTHILKAVKKSGYFMLLDKLRISVPDLIGASTAAFDKADQQADLSVTTTDDVSTLSSITNGGVALTAGTDYTAAGNTVDIKNEYLAAQPLGTTELTFVFNGGATQTLSIVISDSAATNSVILPKTASFDKKTSQQADVTTALTLNGNQLIGISNGLADLVSGTHYSVADDVVSINKSYLATLPNGTTKLTFKFDRGESQVLTIVVNDSTGESSTIIPSAVSFDKKVGAQADISTNITLNGNSLIGITDGAIALSAGDDYLLSGSQLTIKKEYLAGKSNGMTNLTLAFSAGADQTLAIAVSDTARGRYVAVNDDDSEISYKGAWQHSRNRGFGDYKDDVHFTENNNDYFEYTFKGTGIEIITEKESAQGDIAIYVDNVYKQTVSTYSSNRQVQQTVYSLEGLTDGTHTIKVVKKSGYYMLLDHLKVKVADMISPDAASFDKTAQADITTTLNIDGSNLLTVKNGEAALTAGTDYTIAGNAITIKKEYLAAQPDGAVSLAISYKGDYQNDLHGTQTNGDYAEFTFTGTGIDLITPKSAQQGDIDIYIDGVFKKTVSALDANRLTQQSVYSISSLANGRHTLKAVKKSGDYLLVDGVRFSVDAATVPSPTPSTEPSEEPSTQPSASPSTEPSESPSPTPVATPPASSGGITTPPPAKETISLDVGSAKAVITRTTQADGKKHDDVAMTAEQVRKALESLTGAGSKFLNFVVADAKDEVSQTTVTLPKEANADIAAAKTGLGIATDYAKVIVPSELFTAFSDNLYFRFVPVKEAAKTKEISERASKEAVIKFVAGSQVTDVVGHPVSIETNVKHGNVTVVLPLKDVKLSDAELKNLGVYIEHSDGSKQLLEGEIVTYNDKGDKGLQFTVSGFSLFALVHVPGLADSSFNSAYMNGYEEGTFKPDKKVTRAEIAAILSRLVSREEVTEDIAYLDVNASNWAKEAISKVTKMGLMKGYENGSFGAGKSITRGEMAKLVSTLIGGSDKTGAGFTDVSGYWAEADILNVQSAGIINGYADGSFKPNGELTRAEAASIMNKLLGRAKVSIAAQSPWKDVPVTHWAFGDILAASAE